jgi:ribosomal protein S18 acetylase RimI-like enzyme
LQDANNQYYLAYSEGIAVGYLKLNLSDAANGLEIARIYARQTHWGRGVGQALLQQAITVAQTNRIPYIWLGVWQQNPRAISFYQKMGFAIIGTMPYYMGDEAQTDWIMKLKA